MILIAIFLNFMMKSKLIWMTCDECSKKSKVLLIQQHCFSKKTKEHIARFKNVDEILARISRMYNKPACFVDSLLEPVKNMNQLPEANFIALKNIMLP